ncbi:hypothetical protein [Carnobacterium divergens]|uniref:hypothetical protein n=1 Tax=Carnobacterium divergens TaxID=2748 RepID=UPI00288F34A1|nr:hypothetical protein [Carnobacterium divergens]MDT2011141.1 hypothetical protein [Carnobacterium divergens]
MSRLGEINNLAAEIISGSYFQGGHRIANKNAKKIFSLSEPVELNENQQIVLDWMKRDLPNRGVDSLLCELTFLSCTGGWMKNEVTARAYRNLSDIERLQVLQAFAEWGLGHERTN